MHLVIISGATRAKNQSNTAKIIEAFRKGYESKGHTTEVWYLADRSQWEMARAAFYKNDNILFALPLYVENIPGSMLEFLETIEKKKEAGTKIAFLLQGGFPEASQLRCCETYLETLPAMLGCEYAGTLLKGDMFGLSLVDDKQRVKALQPFEEMGKRFAKTHSFNKEEVNQFAGPEFFPKGVLRGFHLIGRHIQRIFMNKIAKSLGCKQKLDVRPYGHT